MVVCVALRRVGVVGSLCEGPFALGVGFVPHPLHFHLPIVFCVFGDVCTGERWNGVCMGGTVRRGLYGLVTIEQCVTLCG